MVWLHRRDDQEKDSKSLWFYANCWKGILDQPQWSCLDVVDNCHTSTWPSDSGTCNRQHIFLNTKQMRVKGILILYSLSHCFSFCVLIFNVDIIVSITRMLILCRLVLQLTILRETSLRRRLEVTHKILHCVMVQQRNRQVTAAVTQWLAHPPNSINTISSLCWIVGAVFVFGLLGQLFYYVYWG